MSRSVTDARYAFKATTFDATSGLTRDFVVLFFYEDHSVELIDETNKKTFLKRAPCPNLTKQQFFIGSNIVIFGRLFTLTAYADRVTEQLSEKFAEATIAVLSGPEVFARIGRLLDVIIQECTFSLREMHTVALHSSDWKKADENGTCLLPQRFAEKQALVLYLIRDNAIAKAQELPRRLGFPSDVWVAQSKQDVAKGDALVHLSKTRPTANVAPDGFGAQSESLPSSSVVVVKPYTVSMHRGGEVLTFITEAAKRKFNINLRIVALSQYTLASNDAERFMQPYKGILKDYRSVVENLSSGALWAVQFMSDDEECDVASLVRELVGPFDPVIAKVLRPDTLRAKMGVDCVRNVVHCSDLPDDGVVDASFWWGGSI